VSADSRAIQDAIAAQVAAKQEALEEQEVYRVLADADIGLRDKLDEAMEVDMGYCVPEPEAVEQVPPTHPQPEATVDRRAREANERERRERDITGVGEGGDEPSFEDEAWDDQPRLHAEDAVRAELIVMEYEIDQENMPNEGTRQSAQQEILRLDATRKQNVENMTALLAAKTKLDAVQAYAAAQEKAVKEVAVMQSQLALHAGIKQRMLRRISELSDDYPAVKVALEEQRRRKAGMAQRNAATTGSTASSHARGSMQGRRRHSEEMAENEPLSGVFAI
jgi:hypothetical protein